jgi:hypothetical protein
MDGAPVDGLRTSDVGLLIAGRQTAHVELELENHRAADAADVRARYIVDIAIPDDRELAEVDRAFVRCLAVDRPSTRDIDSYAASVQRFASARRYSGALGDYAHGVLAKEGSEYSGATLPFEAFETKFSRALDELSDHVERPVAAAVVATARLNLNDVTEPYTRTGDRRLDQCLHVLHTTASLQPKLLTTPARTGALVSLCPIDRDTHFILGGFESLLLDDDPRRRIDELDGRADDGNLSAYDRTKLRVLIINGARRIGAWKVVRRHLETLEHDPVFGTWAEAELERL